jgi:hypothetical protein
MQVVVVRLLPQHPTTRPVVAVFVLRMRGYGSCADVELTGMLLYFAQVFGADKGNITLSRTV